MGEEWKEGRSRGRNTPGYPIRHGILFLICFQVVIDEQVEPIRDLLKDE